MRWVTYTSPDGADRAGLVVNDVVHGLDAPLLNLLGDLAAAGQRARSAPAETLPLAEARLRAPVPQPPSVRDFLSFEEHAKNACAAFGRDVDPVWYSQPVLYFTNPAAVRGPGRHGRVIEPDLHRPATAHC